MHRRAAIRAKLVEILSAIPDVLVYAGYYVPQSASPLPSIAVVTQTEAPEDDESGMHIKDGLVHTRSLDVELEIRVQAPQADAAADAVALLAEQAIGADLTLAGEAQYIDYRGADTARDGDGEDQIIRLTLAYSVRYRVLARDPQALR